MSIRVIDLFSGVGGLSDGFMRGFEIVYANDVDQSICNSFQLNHPNIPIECNDINSIDISNKFKKFDNIGVVIGVLLAKVFLKKGVEGVK